MIHYQGRSSQPAFEVRNEILISAPAERVWDLLTSVGGWPSWYRACQWVQVNSIDDTGRPVTFRWRAHPITLNSTVVASDRPYLFAIVADAPGLHAERTFTIQPAPNAVSTLVVSRETQVGIVPRLARVFIEPRLRAANQVMFEDLSRAAIKGTATQLKSAAA